MLTLVKVKQDRWCIISSLPNLFKASYESLWKTQFRELENVSHNRRLNHNRGKYRGHNCQVYKPQINGTTSSCFLLLLKKHYLHLEISCTCTPKSSQFSPYFLGICLQNKVFVNNFCSSFKKFCKEGKEITKVKGQAAGLVKSEEGITLLPLKIFSKKKSTSSVKKMQTRILYNLTSKNQRQFWWR